MPKLHENETSAFYESDVIPFSGRTAMLGAKINGAAPQMIYGLYIDAEVSDFSIDTKTVYFLRGVMNPDLQKGFDANPRPEVIAHITDLNDLELLLGGIATLSSMGGGDIKLPEKYDAYPNTFVSEFDEEFGEGCQENASGAISSTGNGGFNLTFHGDKDRPKIATLYAELSQVGIAKTLDVIRNIKSWTEDKVHELDQRLNAGPKI